MASGPGARRVEHPLRRGALRVEVDASAQRIRISFVRRGWRGPTLTTTWRAQLTSILAIEAIVVAGTALVWAFGFGWLAVPALVIAVVLALIHVPTELPDVVVDTAERAVWVGGERLELDEARVRVDGRVWELADRHHSAYLGAVLGAPRATWLAETLQLARRGRLGDVDLGPTAGALEVPEDPAPDPADFDVGPAGIAGSLPTSTRSIAQGFVVRACWPILVLLPAILLSDGPTPLVMGEVAAAIVVINVAWALAAVRRRHHRVAVDDTWLHWLEGRTPHRLALADIAAVHLGPRALQLQRADGSSLLLGHGWDGASLTALHAQLVRAVAGARPDAAPALSAVPDALRRLQGRASSAASRGGAEPRG